MRITLIGPGRAGMVIALAARAAGHQIVAVMARRLEAAGEAAEQLDSPEALPLDGVVPSCDLALLAVRDDAIGTIASRIAKASLGADGVVHLSGLAPISVLGAVAEYGHAVGSFHPLQSLPTPEAGSLSLPGAWIAVTTDNVALRETMHILSNSIGAYPFDLADKSKPLYHAAAAAAANFPLAALAMAEDLFKAAGVPFEAAGPLVAAVVANAFEFGPRAALTGPVARGDVGTVAAQIDAVAGAAPEWLNGFRVFVAELARVTGRTDQFRDVVEARGDRWS